MGDGEVLDENSGKPQLLVEVYQARAGTCAARVVETLFARVAVCTACGATYASKAALVARGTRLDVPGCMGPICQSQTWTREN